jgi:hypothetical protein
MASSPMGWWSDIAARMHDIRRLLRRCHTNVLVVVELRASLERSCLDGQRWPDVDGSVTSRGAAAVGELGLDRLHQQHVMCRRSNLGWHVVGPWYTDHLHDLRCWIDVDPESDPQPRERPGRRGGLRGTDVGRRGVQQQTRVRRDGERRRIGGRDRSGRDHRWVAHRGTTDCQLRDSEQQCRPASRSMGTRMPTRHVMHRHDVSRPRTELSPSSQDGLNNSGRL